mmetsp:Transcript_3583/g.6768  ORF Transcript_3583/g.6768 Transcript_3583/m.6768 type:complete len:132 (-) Transcript_3583:67-462(-)
MQYIRQFALERNWFQYHTPRNIVLAMMGQMGELADFFQWLGDIPLNDGDGTREEQEPAMVCGIKGWKEEDKDHLEQEWADVSIYCLRLADVVRIQDLGPFVISSAGDHCEEYLNHVLLLSQSNLLDSMRNT